MVEPLGEIDCDYQNNVMNNGRVCPSGTNMKKFTSHKVKMEQLNMVLEDGNENFNRQLNQVRVELANASGLRSDGRVVQKALSGGKTETSFKVAVTPRDENLAQSPNS